MVFTFSEGLKMNKQETMVICATCYSVVDLPDEPVEIGRPHCEDCSICGTVTAED